MKLFTEIRKQKPSGDIVFDKKMKTISGKAYPVQIHKDNNGYTAYIDGDKLATFRSERDAKKGIEQTMKDL
jgi:hypothetical protein